MQRVATQSGCELESVRAWVAQADICKGKRGRVPSDSAAKNRMLEQENGKLARANEILKSAASSFQSVPDRQHKR